MYGGLSFFTAAAAALTAAGFGMGTAYAGLSAFFGAVYVKRRTAQNK